MTKCHSVLNSIVENVLEVDQVNPELVTWIGQCLQLGQEHVGSTLGSLHQGLAVAVDSTLAGAYLQHIDRLISMVSDCAWPSAQTLGGDVLFVIIRDHVLTTLRQYEEFHEDWGREELVCKCEDYDPISVYLQNAHTATQDFHLLAVPPKHV